MSHVFIANETALGRTVVVKLLRPELAESVNIGRFRREILLAAQLQHPCIVPLLSAGEVNGLPYFTMPFVVGESLRTRIVRSGAIAIPEVVRILREMASALQYAHERGVVHRDIKPDNVLLSGGFALITDFGVAKALTAAAGDERPADLTQTGMAIGTPGYMAPEQVFAEPSCDHRVDIYAFGMVGYEALTGRHPFAGRSSQAMAVAQVVETPASIGDIRHDTPAELVTLIHQCVAKEPGDRPESAASVMEALEMLILPSQFRIATPESGTPTGTREFRDTLARAATLSPTLAAPHDRAERPATRTVRRANRKRKPIDSLAVLPFFNASGDADNEFLSDGIAESIINKLSVIPGLRIVPRSIAFRYRERDVDPQAVASTMNVRAFVTGRVFKRENTLIVKAELVDAQNESQLWGEQYNRAFTDIFSVQEHMASEISQCLQHRLTHEDWERIVKRDTENSAAYQAYLKGRYHWNKRTIEGLRSANRFFSDAIAEDPAYAPAYAGLADTYNVLGYYGSERPHDAFPRAKAAALRALELDRSLAEAHASLGFAVLFYDRDYRVADKELTRAIELKPGYATAHQWYAWYLFTMERFDDAVASLQRARDLDPLSLIINDHLSYALALLGRYDDAIEQCRKTIELDASFPFTYWRLGELYFVLGRYDESAAEYQRTVEATGGLVALGYLSQALAAAGRADEARAALARLERLARARYVSPLELALAHAGMGETEAAFAFLDRAYDDHTSDLARVKLLPWPDHVRGDSRFADLVRRLGLMP